VEALFCAGACAAARCVCTCPYIHVCMYPLGTSSHKQKPCFAQVLAQLCALCESAWSYVHVCMELTGACSHLALQATGRSPSMHRHRQCKRVLPSMPENCACMCACMRVRRIPGKDVIATCTGDSIPAPSEPQSSTYSIHTGRRQLPWRA